jgi:hypothetical protein
MLQDDLIDTPDIQRFGSFIRWGQPLEIHLVPQDLSRVGFKGEHDRMGRFLLGTLAELLQHFLMAKMDPIKYTDSQPGVLQAEIIKRENLGHGRVI